MTTADDIRFCSVIPQLCDEWETRPFERCLKPAPSNYSKLKQKDLLETGKLPVIDQGENFVSGYTDDENAKYPGSLPVVIFGDHTRRFKYVDFSFAVGADGTKLLHPIDQLKPKFFYYYMLTLNLESQGYSRHYRFLKESRVPFPPLAEQRRIVGKLEEILGKLSSIQQRLSRIPALLKRFRQSVLAAACSGKLSASWREKNKNTGTAQMILNQTDAEQFQGKTQIRSKAIINVVDRRIPYPEGDFFELPETWVWSEFGRITINHDRGRVPVKESDRAKRHGPYPYYGAFGVIDEFDDYRFDGTYLLLAEDGKNLESRTRPIALQAAGKFWVNNHAHVLSAKPGISLGYVEAWLNSSTLNLSPFLTGIDQVKLNREAMEQIPVPLPPLPEQQEIVRRVEQHFLIAEEVEARFEKAKTQINRITQSVLAKAFRGELVPTEAELARREGRDYESAQQLLERIRGMEPKAKVAKKKTSKKANRQTADE